jgi:multiple sugar transport system substrate-binding protein
MSGGWLLSVGSHATNKQMAFNFISLALDQQNSLWYDIHASQVASRDDVASAPAYKAQGPITAEFATFVPFTHFRPAFSAYPKLSTEIQEITGEVMTGQSTPAQGAAAYNKYLIATVGASNVEAAPM